MGEVFSEGCLNNSTGSDTVQKMLMDHCSLSDSCAALRLFDDLRLELLKKWPDNRAVNIVCHGHSVPSGYFQTPVVDSFNAYPHFLHKLLKEAYPFAVINVIVTAIGGEESDRGERRFESDVLCHRPDIVTIDYGLNDRRLSLETAKISWQRMIEACLLQNTSPLLLTPSFDSSFEKKDAAWQSLCANAEQIRNLAKEYHLALVDSFKIFEDYINKGNNLWDLLSHPKHPNAKGHMLIAKEIFETITERIY